MISKAREIQVVRVFRNTDRPDLTIREVSEEMDVHYDTAREHIKRLESKGVLAHTRSSGTTKLYGLSERGTNAADELAELTGRDPEEFKYDGDIPRFENQEIVEE